MDASSYLRQVLLPRIVTVNFLLVSSIWPLFENENLRNLSIETANTMRYSLLRRKNFKIGSGVKRKIKLIFWGVRFAFNFLSKQPSTRQGLLSVWGGTWSENYLANYEKDIGREGGGCEGWWSFQLAGMRRGRKKANLNSFRFPISHYGFFALKSVIDYFWKITIATYNLIHKLLKPSLE